MYQLVMTNSGRLDCIIEVIFDMGNVLLSYNPEIPLDLFCTTREAKDLIRHELFEGPEWIQGDYGYITNEERTLHIFRTVINKKTFLRNKMKCVEKMFVNLRSKA